METRIPTPSLKEKFVQIAACLDQQAFRLIEIERDSICITPIDVIDEQVLENAKIVYDNINYFKHNPDARGEESERRCEVETALPHH